MGRPWGSQDAKLIRPYNRGDSTVSMAETLDRTIDSVAGRLRVLRRKRLIEDGSAMSDEYYEGMAAESEEDCPYSKAVSLMEWSAWMAGFNDGLQELEQ